MKRRTFLQTAGAAIAAPALPSPAAAAAEPPAAPAVPALAAALRLDPRTLLEADGEATMALAERVFRKCVLEKIRPPVEPLLRTWVVPGGPHYLGQWIWDTMFVVDLLSMLPGTRPVIRDIFQNYWDFQDRWNRTMPDYARDMITVAIKTAPQEQRQFSQIPILAWGLERVYQRNGDRQLLNQCLGRLERFHDWFWRERDVTGTGLIAVGAYSGLIQHARWETFDYDCSMDGLRLTPHPTRKGDAEGAWYGDICVTGNTAYLILAERCLVRLAEIAGDREMMARRQPRIEKAAAAMRQHMWDEQAGTFLAVKRDTLERIPGATIGSWMALAAGVPTPAMAARMAEVLASPAWQTPLPVPTVDRTDKRWQSDAFWRGDVWPSTNYQIAAGLAAYGHRDLAADIADKSVANAIQHGISEHYDSVSGRPLGVRDYCMSCTLATMMLDGLTRRHALRRRESAPSPAPAP
ncbi:MAG: twin-arginine translocation signal domain-containing protein [Akkermansiaceae bacterium]|jgi:glycogen debranching enzyme|nr:twin-arginine translocation signal domain-containing protein [Akkermansiaceae bacterium]